MGRTTKLITEYKQTSGDADGDNIVEIWCGWGWCGAGTKYLPCHRRLRVFPDFVTDLHGPPRVPWHRRNTLTTAMLLPFQV